MTAEQRQNRITTIFILLSLLLHLLFLLVPKQLLMPVSKAPDPVYVEVRPPQPRDRELDIPIREELVKPREKPAKRLAEKDQVVEKETAPEGKDFEDREKIVRVPQPAPKPVQPAPPVEKPAREAKEEKQEPAPVTPEGWQARPKKKLPKELPDLAALTNISPRAFAKIETDWRRKYREDVEKGDTVWMDTEQDLLISFMRRFRDQIYGVWNYPARAAERNQQGTSLVRITVDRKGNVLDIDLLESSGYSALDHETLRAIRKGASYGPLPRAYPNEDLKIMAYFQYNISNVRTIKRRRPGDIY
jgi:protein TonB